MLFGRKKRRISRLLLVEDEPLVAFDAEHLLSEEDYHIVATVDRVAQAVRIIGEESEIDLVLVDVELTDGSGIDVARAAAARGIPVLFVTGNCPGDVEALAFGSTGACRGGCRRVSACLRGRGKAASCDFQKIIG